MAERRNVQTRRKRRFRPLRRILLLLLAGIVVFGFVRTASWAYSRVFGEKVQVVRAQSVALTALFQGTGVILREEVVVVAPRPGTVNSLAESLAEVTAGDEILEIVDRDRLAEIEKLIAAEEEKLGGSGGDALVALADAELALKQATGKLRELTAAYATALRKGEISQVTSLFHEIGLVTEQVNQYDRAFQAARTASVDLGSRYEELIEQRETAIHKVVAPVSGIMTWTVDELSGTVNPALQPARVLDLINGGGATGNSLSSGTHVPAGSALCAIVDPVNITLVIELDKDLLWSPDDQIEIRVNGQVAEMFFEKSVPISDQSALCYFQFSSVPEDAVKSRWVAVELWPVRPAAFSVPASSLIQVEGASALYALDQEGTVGLVEVAILEKNGSQAIVTGLPGNSWIVSNPELVTVGDTVATPKGD